MKPTGGLPIRRGAGVLLFALLAFSCSAAQPRSRLQVAAAWRDVWQAVENDVALDLTSDQIVYREGATTVFIGLLSQNAGDLKVRKYGSIERWQLTVEADRLLQEVNGRRIEYKRASDATGSLKINDVVVASARPLPVEDIAEIQREIAGRLATDQAALKDPAKKADWPRINAENRAYLRSLVARIGWIDVKRFGAKTSYGAVILAKHSTDLGLLRSILPYVESDFASAGGDAQAFAIVDDDVRLKLGERQVYGSQVCRDAAGSPFVCSLEKPSEVDARRARLGLPKLAGYLGDVSRMLFKGQTVRVPLDSDEQ